MPINKTRSSNAILRKTRSRVDQIDPDATGYLQGTATNARRLHDAVAQLKAGKGAMSEIASQEQSVKSASSGL